MTKKHYILFAKAIDCITSPHDASQMARFCAEIFKEENSRFDSLRFFNACHLDPEGYPEP